MNSRCSCTRRKSDYRLRNARNKRTQWRRPNTVSRPLVGKNLTWRKNHVLSSTRISILKNYSGWKWSRYTCVLLLLIRFLLSLGDNFLVAVVLIGVLYYRFCMQRQVSRKRGSHEVVGSTYVAFATHRRGALAATEQIRNEKIAMRLEIPEATVSVFVAHLAEFRRWELK